MNLTFLRVDTGDFLLKIDQNCFDLFIEIKPCPFSQTNHINDPSRRIFSYTYH